MADLINDLKNHHKRFIAEFIKLYKSFPALWKVKSPEYNDRDNKRDAYVQLVQKLQEVEPSCTKHDVIKKINSLRSAFRREYRKVRRMRACGKLYNPTLWYYDLLLFTITENRSKTKRVTEIVLESPPQVDPLDVPLVKEEELDDLPVDDYSTFEAEESNVLSAEEYGMNSFSNFQDEFDAIGYNVASKLRNMATEQRIIAERVIAETLYQGQMSALKLNRSPSDFVSSIVYNGHRNYESRAPP